MQCNRRGRRHWILRDMMPQGVPRKLNSWQPERFFLFIFFFLIRSAYWSECLTQNNKKTLSARGTTERDHSTFDAFWVWASAEKEDSAFPFHTHTLLAQQTEISVLKKKTPFCSPQWVWLGFIICFDSCNSNL